MLKDPQAGDAPRSMISLIKVGQSANMLAVVGRWGPTVSVWVAGQRGLTMVGY